MNDLEYKKYMKNASKPRTLRKSNICPTQINSIIKTLRDILRFSGYSKIADDLHLLIEMGFTACTVAERLEYLSDLFAMIDVLDAKDDCHMSKGPKDLDSIESLVFIAYHSVNKFHGGGLRVIDLAKAAKKSGVTVSLYSVCYSQDDFASSVVSECMEVFDKVFITSNPSMAEIALWLTDGSAKYDVGYFVWPGSTETIKGLSSFFRVTCFELIECTARRVCIDIQNITRSLKSYQADVCRELVRNFRRELEGGEWADYLIGVTPEDLNFYRPLINSRHWKPIIISTGISYDLIEVADKLKHSHCLNQEAVCTAFFVGNYFHYPNIDGLQWFFEEVYPLVMNCHPKLVVKIAGRGIHLLEERISNLNTKCMLLGEIESLGDAIATSTFCISPLISGAGLRGKLLQYAVFGKTTVTTSIGAEGTTFLDSVDCLIRDSPKAFADAMISLASSYDLRERLGRCARENIDKNYSYDDIFTSFVHQLTSK